MEEHHPPKLLDLGFGSCDALPTTYMNPLRLQDNVIIDVRVNHCSHISGLLLEVIVFLAPMVICAHPPHHPYGL